MILKGLAMEYQVIDLVCARGLLSCTKYNVGTAIPPQRAVIKAMFRGGVSSLSHSGLELR